MEKFAAKTPVRGHLRKVQKGYALVDRHEREIEEKKKTRKDLELEMWGTWNKGGRKPKDLRPLMASLEPLIQKEARTYKNSGVRIPDAAIDLEYRTQALNALRTYDPTRGAALATHVVTYLQKARRFITQNQNIARIPEHRVYKIREYQEAVAALEDQLGKPPTEPQLAGHLKWSVKEVGRMATELRSDLRAHSFESDMTEEEASKERELLRFLRYELDPEEERVYDLYVVQGITSTNEIAKKTKFPLYKVSRIKKKIADKAAYYLAGTDVDEP